MWDVGCGLCIVCEGNKGMGYIPTLPIPLSLLIIFFQMPYRCSIITRQKLLKSVDPLVSHHVREKDVTNLKLRGSVGSRARILVHFWIV
jgi:hypothetical protein